MGSENGSDIGSEDETRPSLEVSFGRAGAAPRPPRKPREPRAPRAKRERPVRDPRPPREPYGIVVTSVLTGLVVGLALVGAGAGALRGCAAARGTSSCGAAGVPILVIILAAGVVLGAVALRLLSQTRSATSISFLALAFVAVVSCLFLLDPLDGPAALVIVPVLSIVGYLGAHLLTSRYIETS